MGDKESAIKWVVGLAIYFFVFSLIMTFAIGLNDNYSYNDGGINDIEELREKGTDCSYPRVLNSNISFFSVIFPLIAFPTGVVVVLAPKGVKPLF